MTGDLDRLVFELAQLRRAPAATTAGFSRMRHNRDLCPRTQATCERALSAFTRYRDIAYDIQGPRDAGVDVLIRTEADREMSLICFQIKSDRELAGSDLLKTLKSQWFDATSRYDAMVDYYIMLCGDADRRKSVVRGVAGEFADTPNVTVIEPTYAWSFLHVPPMTVDAVIRGRLMEGDVVVKEALQLVSGMTPTEVALLAHLVTSKAQGEFLSFGSLLETGFLESTYRSSPDVDRWVHEYPDDVEEADSTLYAHDRDFESRLADDLDALEDGWISQRPDGCFTVHAADAHLSLLLDGKVRYGYSGPDLSRYLFELLTAQKSS